MLPFVSSPEHVQYVWHVRVSSFRLTVSSVLSWCSSIVIYSTVCQSSTAGRSQLRSAGSQWAFCSLNPSLLPPQTHTAIVKHTHAQSPCLIVLATSLLALASLFVPLSVSGMWIICTASLPSCVWDWFLLSLEQMNFCTHCSCLCACVLLVGLPKCHSVKKLA